MTEQAPLAKSMYETYLKAWSDIEVHLTHLHELAHGTVVELGVRHGISTSALLTGVEDHGGEVWSYDLDRRCGWLFSAHPQWHFIEADSEETYLVPMSKLPIDLLFIDTVHTYEKTLSEITAWWPLMRQPGGRILLHDTDDGSTFPGVRQAIHAFCGFSKFYWLYPGSYGLGEIEC